MDNKWRTIACDTCSGGGVVAHYYQERDEGIGMEPGDCPDCGGTGRFFIRPKGHLFMYPGGPAMGRWDEAAYKKALNIPEPPERNDQ